MINGQLFIIRNNDINIYEIKYININTKPSPWLRGKSSNNIIDITVLVLVTKLFFESLKNCFISMILLCKFNFMSEGLHPLWRSNPNAKTLSQQSALPSDEPPPSYYCLNSVFSTWARFPWWAAIWIYNQPYLIKSLKLNYPSNQLSY